MRSRPISRSDAAPRAGRGPIVPCQTRIEASGRAGYFWQGENGQHAVSPGLIKYKVLENFLLLGAFGQSLSRCVGIHATTGDPEGLLSSLLANAPPCVCVNMPHRTRGASKSTPGPQLTFRFPGMTRPHFVLGIMVGYPTMAFHFRHAGQERPRVSARRFLGFWGILSPVSRSRTGCVAKRNDVTVGLSWCDSRLIVD